MDYSAVAIALVLLYIEVSDVLKEVQASAEEVISSRAHAALMERARPGLYVFPRDDVSGRRRL